MFMDLKSRAAMHDFHVHMITTDDHRRMKGVITAAFGADTRMATTAAAAAAERLRSGRRSYRHQCE